jgi:hypothetical protein
MRTAVVTVLLSLLTLVPPADASVTYNQVLPPQPPFAIPVPWSTPVLQSTHEYDMNLLRGDQVSVSLTWTAGGPVPNDLDLTVLLPSGGPCVLVLDPRNPDFVASLMCTANSRVGRTTCTDAIAESNNHQLLGGPSSEAVAFTVPPAGEEGRYAILVRGWTVTSAQPYTLAVTVIRGGTDTSSNVGLPVIVPPNGPPASAFITTNPNCQLT